MPDPEEMQERLDEVGRHIDEARKDHLGDPEAPVEMRQHEHERTEVTIARPGKQGLERQK